MTAALEKTFEVLSTSRNEASVLVLLTALEKSEGTIYENTLKSLITRRNRIGHTAVLGHWQKLTETQREIVSQGRGKMSAALRDAILSTDENLFQNACDVMVRFREFDLVSALITLAEDRSHPHSNRATELVLQMVSQLVEMVHGKRDPNDRRDPTMIRRHVMEGLERSVERFRTHQRNELIEAFVILGGISCSLLRNILDDPHHVCYLTVVNTLSTSQSPGVVKLLLNFLGSDHPSLAILTVISRRSDEEFLRELFDFLECNLSQKVTKNLHRIRSFPWLEEQSFSVTSLADNDQPNCVRMLAESGMDQDRLLDILSQFVNDGSTVGRVAACEALAEVPGEKSNQLFIDNMHDEEPQVQAAVARQLRDRHIAGTMSVLVKLLDSPHAMVRDAARESLSEFTYENFVKQFDTLHDDSRQTTGSLVKKVDLELQIKLASDLKSKSRRTQMRTIEIAEVLEFVSQVADELIALLEDSDHLVRAAAATALQYCPTPMVQEALEQAAHDRSSAVQSAAKSSLELMQTAGPQQANGSSARN